MEESINENNISGTAKTTAGKEYPYDTYIYNTKTTQEIRYINTINGQRAWCLIGTTGVAPQWQIF